MAIDKLPRNTQRALEALVRAPEGLDRATLGDRLSLSRPTVTTTVETLLAERLVQERAPLQRSADRGRPAKVIRCTRNVGCAAVIDLGHRHVHVGLVSAGGELIAVDGWTAADDEHAGRDVRLAGIDEQGPAVIDGAVSVLAAALAESSTSVSQLRGVALGIPAPLRRGKRVAAPGFLTSWAGVDIEQVLRKALRRRFGGTVASLPVCVANDATLGLMGEIAARGGAVENLVFAKLSSRIGMAIWANGSTVLGHHGFAAGLAHMRMPVGGPLPAEMGGGLRPCATCGRADCLESIASGDAILARMDAGGERAATLEDAIARAVSDPAASEARRAIVEAGLNIGAALAEVAMLLDPEIIVIGGRLAKAGPILQESVADGLRGRLLLADVPVELVPAGRLDHLAILGGAQMIWRRFARDVVTTSGRSASVAKAAKRFARDDDLTREGRVHPVG